MRLMTYLALLLVLVHYSGCAHNQQDVFGGRIQVVALQDTDRSAVQVTESENEISFHFNTIPPEGAFFRLILPLKTSVGANSWQGSDQVLHLVVNTASGADLGVCPLADYDGSDAVLRLELSDQIRTTSAPPLQEENIVDDLEVKMLSETVVNLGWTERNIGDYDMNGEVSVADITPLGQYFGRKGFLDNPNARDTPEYWIDGDQNGEINISDLSVIGSHYGNNIDSYAVKTRAAGEEVSTEVYRTKSEDRISRDGLPSLYSVMVDGEHDARWDVVPVDVDGIEGISGIPTEYELNDLRIEVSSGQMSLYTFNCIETSEDRYLEHILRVIEDTIIVDAMTFKPTYYPMSSAHFFSELPDNKPLTLQVLIAPTVNLVTGAKKPKPIPVGGELYPSDLSVFAVPISLNQNGSTKQIALQLGYDEKLSGGYLVNLGYREYLTGGLEVISWNALIDMPEKIVRRDNDGDGNFKDEFRLTDSNLDGISDAHQAYRKEVASSEYIQGTVTHNGYVVEYNENEGRLRIQNTIKNNGDKESGDFNDWMNSGDANFVDIRFSELTGFDDKAAEAAYGDEKRLNVTELRFGDFVQVDVTILFVDSTSVYWANKMTVRGSGLALIQTSETTVD